MCLKKGLFKSKKWFLYKLKNLVQMEKYLMMSDLTPEKYKDAKDLGFLDSTIKRLSGQEPPMDLPASYKMVDTCAAEFEAQTPYFYSTYDEENEAKEFIEARDEGKKILVFGSGPIRIGQGIEFDYCSVHCINSIREAGHEAIIINNNPETVSTDFDISDRLYFEPLTPEDVDNIIETEKPDGVIVQFGGQTAIKLIKYLSEKGVESVMLNKFNEPEPNTNKIFDTGKIDFVVSTSKIGRDPAVQSVQMRRKAIERSIITLTSVDTANALVNCLLSDINLDNVHMVDITKI